MFFYFGYPTVDRCTVENNTAEYWGGGIYSDVSSLILTNSALSNNKTNNQSGGGFYGFYTSPAIANCLFYGNTAAGAGGGILCDYINPLILNCTFSGNSAGNGGAVYCEDSSPKIINSILWGDAPNEIRTTGDSFPIVEYCDIEDGYSGEGNLDENPIFYPGLQGIHYLAQLAAGQGWQSVCADAGADLAADVCFLTGDGIHCLDEYTTRTDHVADQGLADLGHHYPMPVSPTPTMTPTPSPTQMPATATPEHVIYVPEDYDTIQAAIDAAEEGDMVLVSDGTYTGTGNKNLDFHGKEIITASVSGPELCVIDCENSGRGFHFHTNENRRSILDGFTIQNGYNYNQDGAGIYCNRTSPVIKNCIIMNNSTSTGQRGGGIYCYEAEPLIENCTVTGNTCPNGYGGGIAGRYASPVIIKCDVTDNYARSGGGMHFYLGYPTVDDCTVTNNTSTYWGGGIYSDVSELNLTNSVLAYNAAENQNGAGFYGHYISSVIINCLFHHNSAAGTGGGIFCDYNDAVIMNCTFTDNTASNGGAVYCDDSSPQLINCILWSDTPNEFNYTGDSIPVLNYCDVEDGFSGDGNIDADPVFTSGSLGDHYLSQTAAGQTIDSPCKDAGDSPSSDVCYRTDKWIMCMNQAFTRTDEITDDGIVDMGYHYYIPITATPVPPTQTPTQTLTPSPVPTNSPTLTPTFTPTQSPSSSPTDTPTFTTTATLTPAETHTPTITPVPPPIPAASQSVIIILILALTALIGIRNTTRKK